MLEQCCGKAQDDTRLEYASDRHMPPEAGAPEQMQVEQPKEAAATQASAAKPGVEHDYDMDRDVRPQMAGEEQGPPLPRELCCSLCPGTPPNEELEVMGKTWWLLYFLCGGCGFGESYGGCLANCACRLCYSCSVQAVLGAPIDGQISLLSTCCLCCSLAFQLPPRLKTPRCMICSSLLGGEHEPKPKPPSSDSDERLPSATSNPILRGGENNPWDFILYDQFVPCHVCCCGLAIHSCCSAELCRGDMKFQHCRCKCRMGFIAHDSCVSNWCSIRKYRWQCRCSPYSRFQDNPLIACCGCRCIKTMAMKAKSRGKSTQRAASAPKQRTMTTTSM